MYELSDLCEKIFESYFTNLRNIQKFISDKIFAKLKFFQLRIFTKSQSPNIGIINICDHILENLPFKDKF